MDVAVYENFIRIYDFFETVGWNGPNGERTPALLLVDYRVNGEPADNCAYLGYQSGWETFGFARAKDYGAATDIMAHEFVHCLTSTTMTTNLYMNEPGAINEGMSDILGNLTGMALDGDAGAWILGENAVEGTSDAWSWPSGEADTVRAILPAGDYYVMARVGATPPEAENKLYTDKGWVDYSSDEGAINKVGTPVHVDAGQTVNIATDGLA